MKELGTLPRKKGEGRQSIFNGLHGNRDFVYTDFPPQFSSKAIADLHFIGKCSLQVPDVGKGPWCRGAPLPTPGCGWSFLCSFRTRKTATMRPVCPWEVCCGLLPAAWTTLLPLPIPLLRPRCPALCAHGTCSVETHITYTGSWLGSHGLHLLLAQSPGHQQRGRWTDGSSPPRGSQRVWMPARSRKDGAD